MASEIRIEHCYPDALPFLRQHGPDALAVLHDLITHAERRGDELVVQTSIRQIAARLTFLSKDTVHRRLRQLHRARVIRIPTPRTTNTFQRPTYVLDLTGTGISVTTTRRPSS